MNSISIHDLEVTDQTLHPDNSTCSLIQDSQSLASISGGYIADCYVLTPDDVKLERKNGRVVIKFNPPIIPCPFPFPPTPETI